MAWQRYNAEGDALKTAWELASERSEVRRESERAAAERDGCQACCRGAAGPRLRRASGGAGAAAAAGGRFLHFWSAG